MDISQAFHIIAVVVDRFESFLPLKICIKNIKTIFARTGKPEDEYLVYHKREDKSL